MHEDDFEPVKYLFDGSSLLITVGVLFQWLPHATALLAFVWMCFRVYEAYLNTKIKHAQLAKIEGECSE